VPPDAGGKSKARHLTKLLGLFDRIIDGRGAELVRIGQKPYAIRRWFVAVASHKSHNPAVALQRGHDSGDTSLSRGVERNHGFPVGRRIIRDGKDGRGVGDVDPDNSFLRPWSADGVEKCEGEVAAPRGLDDQVGGKGFGFPRAVVETDCGNHLAIGRGHEFQRTAMLAERDVGGLPYALPYGALDQRPGHRVRVPAEIALWKRIKSGDLDAKVETYPERHGSGPGEILLKAGEEIAERTLAATEEHVRMPRLGRSGSGDVSGGRVSRSSTTTCSK
jgi:hypothetical protein